ncbi:YgfZ/GcvT domain-containing protein [Nocardioides jejuensis]|uniref:Folate-binding protein n=1 Tax=Nocardioides jejuensis TaxID=2502782 RepID=A0A4R1CFT7_9ACTN|nr:folate-binding protein YgfZ [Nocardioides jejuensis]TCJ30183.1 folate-binding protein [Nocardioides jejuensis]
MSDIPKSPLLALPGAVAGDGIDAPVAAHYGSFNAEQRRLAGGDGFVDLSHRDVVRISGPERLAWLHNLTTQQFTDLPAGRWVTALILSPQGHVEHAFTGVDDGEAFVAHTEPGAGEALRAFLGRMIFMTRVEVDDATDELAVAWRATGSGEGKYEFVPRDRLTSYAEAAGPAAGMWAFEALRIERGEPRLGLDTDHRTIPNEVGWVPAASVAGVLGEAAVHLEKGCYRGQETVARVHTLGRPPRRLVLLHLDGSENRLPAAGSPLLYGDKEVGVVGTSARHHELGPIALALVKRNVPVDAALSVDGMPAAQEVVVDPEIGLHVRPNLR